MQFVKLILICYCSKIIAFAQRSVAFCLALREEKIREEKKRKRKKEAFATNLLEIKIKRFKTLKKVNVYEYTKKVF